MVCLAYFLHLHVHKILDVKIKGEHDVIPVCDLTAESGVWEESAVKGKLCALKPLVLTVHEPDYLGCMEGGGIGPAVVALKINLTPVR